MFVIIGMGIVTAAVVGGYLYEDGNLSLLLQPAEAIIIFGAAIGSFLVASPMRIIKAVIGALPKTLRHKGLSMKDYIEALVLLNGIFYKIRQQGLVSIESDMDKPEESSLFSKYPSLLKNQRAIYLITDTLRTVMTTTVVPHELEALIDGELDAYYEELMLPSKSLSFVADALPGLGIVAAVMGVVLTMGKIGAPPEVLGHSVGAALVGTFLGVLLCYGYVGPVGKNLEHLAMEEIQYLTVLKVGLIAFVSGAAPKVAVEFGRRVVPADVRPSFMELEEIMRQVKK